MSKKKQSLSTLQLLWSDLTHSGRQKALDFYGFASVHETFFSDDVEPVVSVFKLPAELFDEPVEENEDDS